MSRLTERSGQIICDELRSCTTQWETIAAPEGFAAPVIR
jgi:hypothetical protein